MRRTFLESGRCTLVLPAIHHLGVSPQDFVYYFVLLFSMDVTIINYFIFIINPGVFLLKPSISFSFFNYEGFYGAASRTNNRLLTPC